MKFNFTFLILLFTVFTIAAQDLVVDKISGVSSSEYVSDIYKQKDGGLLIGGDKGVYKLYGSDDFASSFSKKRNTIALTSSRAGDLYSIHADQRVYKNQDEIYNVSGAKIELKDVAIHKSKLWIASSNGVYCINVSTSKLLKHYTSSNSQLLSNKVNFVFNDANGVLWIGTDKGLTRVKNDRWKTYEDDASFLAIAENDEGTWIVADKELWLIDRGNRWYPAALQKGLYQGKVNDIILDKSGNLYVASDILVRFNPYENVVEQWGNTIGLVAQKCLALESDDDGAIYVGTASAGLYKIYQGEEKVKQLRILGLIENEIKCIGDAGGSIMVEAFGGSAPYSYQWTDPTMQGNNPQNLITGTYQVTVTDSTGQTTIGEIALDAPEKFDFSISERKAVSDISEKDGFANISISGGTYPYSITWSNGEKGPIARKLSHGTNEFTIVDANNCIWKNVVEIDKPKLLPDLSMEGLELGQTLQIENLFFNADSTSITERNFGLLEEIYDFLNTNKGVVIEIGGHTNNIPPDEYCDKLSSSRAKSVAQFLYNLGIEEGRIAYKGYGKRNPIASNDNVAGRKKNQRVEIKILNLE